jgi:hypothetical protein
MAYGEYTRGGEGIAPYVAKESFDWESMFGPLSTGLQTASGLFGAASKFASAGNLRGTEGQFKLMARQALEQGFQESIDITHAGRETLGAMTSQFGKSGTLLAGSPLLALADQAREIELSATRAVRQGRIQQQAYLYQARQAHKAAEGMAWGGVADIAKTAMTLALL